MFLLKNRPEHYFLPRHGPNFLLSSEFLILTTNQLVCTYIQGGSVPPFHCTKMIPEELSDWFKPTELERGKVRTQTRVVICPVI
jgi:hypothetical protein